jgi:hypothetical protein
MTQIKCIMKNEDGLRFILQLLNKVRNHNETFYSSTLRFFNTIHPPFKDSLIYYDYDMNDFKFISRVNAKKLPIKTWKDYNTNDLCWIKEKSYAIFSITPFSVIVSSAEFLITKYEDQLSAFTKYMIESSDNEIKVYKQLINTKEIDPIKLF